MKSESDPLSDLIFFVLMNNISTNGMLSVCFVLRLKSSIIVTLSLSLLFTLVLSIHLLGIERQHTASRVKNCYSMYVTSALLSDFTLPL